MDHHANTFAYLSLWKLTIQEKKREENSFQPKAACLVQEAVSFRLLVPLSLSFRLETRDGHKHCTNTSKERAARPSLSLLEPSVCVMANGNLGHYFIYMALIQPWPVDYRSRADRLLVYGSEGRFPLVVVSWRQSNQWVWELLIVITRNQSACHWFAYLKSLV